MHCSCAENALVIVCLNFKKAFDRVPHKRLLNKIKAHGIDGRVWRWIQSWLTDRQQRVVINGTASEWLPVTRGITQGSVLGPLLFLIYINDLDDGILSAVSKFADDTKIAFKVNGIDSLDIIKHDLELVHNWGIRWQMEFNVDKCATLHIGRNNPHYQHKLGNNCIKASVSEKDLGITISNNLKFGEQCSVAAKKANKLVGLISRSFNYKSDKIIIKLYNALVRPVLEYGFQAWSPYYIKDIDKLERVQRRVTKMIPRLRCLEYNDRLKKLNMLSLQDRRLNSNV
jgi:hypothetical protein